MENEISVRRALGGAVLVLVGTVAGRVVTMRAVAAASGVDAASASSVAQVQGVLLAAGILGGTSVGAALLGWIARPAPRATLALERPTAKAVVGWTLASLLLLVASRAGTWALGRPLVEPEWIDAYRTAPAALLALALVATSVFEELYFRGLLQTALARTRVGAVGAIAIPTLLFVAAHAPTDAFRFVDVLASALLLAAARATTGSSVTAMLGHVLGNLAILATLARLA